MLSLARTGTFARRGAGTLPAFRRGDGVELASTFWASASRPATMPPRRESSEREARLRGTEGIPKGAGFNDLNAELFCWGIWLLCLSEDC